MKTNLFFIFLLTCLKWSFGVPMVENSVKFALERCKQFLDLAEFMKESALSTNDDLRRTHKVCLHIVEVERDFSQAKPDLVLPLALKKDKPKEEKFNCSVWAFPRQDFQGDRVEFNSDVSNTKALKIKSLRIKGQKGQNCSWRFFDNVDFKGRNFTLGLRESRWEIDAMPKIGWGLNRVKSARKFRKIKSIRKN